MNRPAYPSLLGACLVFACLYPPGEAHALTARYGTAYNDMIVVGMVDIVGDGNAFTVAALCVDRDGTTTGDYVVAIGDHYGLTDDIVIYAGAGDDYTALWAFDANWTTLDDDHCVGGNGLVSGSWSVLAYSGHYLDVYGQADDDITEVRLTAGDTYVYGGAGNDHAYSNIEAPLINGEEGNDSSMATIWSTSYEYLIDTGVNTSNDCLMASGPQSEILGFSCGAGTDTYRIFTSGSPTDGTCETPISDASCPYRGSYWDPW